MAPPPHEQGPLQAPGHVDQSLAPWRGKIPTVFVTGLEKSGTNMMAAAFAGAMGVSYQSEAVSRCCVALDKAMCAKEASDIETTYNFLPNGHFFSRDISRFFDKCKDHTLLDVPRQMKMKGGTQQMCDGDPKIGEWDGCTVRPPVRVLRADELLPDANAFATYIGSEHLNMKLIFVTRHPLTVIRSTQSWVRQLQEKGKHANWPTSVSAIAHMWRKSARVYRDSPECSRYAGASREARPGNHKHYECTFAAVVRFEDLSASPRDIIVPLYKKLFPMSGGHFPGRPAPRDGGLPNGWEERMQEAIEMQTSHQSKYERAHFVNKTYTDKELDMVTEKGGDQLMAKFNYTLADVFQARHMADAL